MPLSQNFSMSLGDTFALPLIVQNADGTAFDLTGCTIEFGVAKLYDSVLQFQKSTGAGILITSAVGGLATITINPADTTALAAGQYSYDIVVKRANGATFTMTIGTISMLAHPSR